jgi:hypothetical protein
MVPGAGVAPRDFKFFKDDIDNLMKKYQKNRDAVVNTSKHLVMSTAKSKALIEYGFDSCLFVGDVIFQDEMTLGEFTPTKDAAVNVWDALRHIPDNEYPRYVHHIKRLRLRGIAYGSEYLRSEHYQSIPAR